MTARLAFVVFALTTLATAATAAEPKPFPGTPTKWEGFARHDFKVGDLDATVVVPEKPLPGRPWVWRGEFFGAFADADVALVKAGWHLAYLKVPDLFGSPEGDQAVGEVPRRDGEGVRHAPEAGADRALPRRAVLHELGGGAPGPDARGVPRQRGVRLQELARRASRRSSAPARAREAEWKKLLAAYDFKSDDEAVAYKLNPVDNLAPLAKAKIPLLLVYGDKDTVVPHAENSELVYDRYKALGGPVERVVKPGQDHHPHGLKDVTPVVKFFTDAFDPKK